MATQQSGAEAPGASESSGPKTQKTPETRETAAPQAADAAAKEAPAQPGLDETKRKFREALERKQGSHASARGADNTGKVHGSHGPAASRRSFRRKSG